MGFEGFPPRLRSPRFKSLQLTNFLSYKKATLNFEDFTALVGPNASGKSNAVAAIKLLREIPIHGLPTAIARRGGIDQLRHRSAGRPNDPALKLTFAYGAAPESFYELKLASVEGRRYRVKSESAVVWVGDTFNSFESDGKTVKWKGSDEERTVEQSALSFAVSLGQSAVTAGGMAALFVYTALQSMQTVGINPARVGDLQEPSSTRDFEPDGSNTTSIYESLDGANRAELVDELAAIVPGIEKIEVRNLADRQTLAFYQQTSNGRREFLAKQMSDGTLRAFGIVLAMLQPSQPSLLVIEEPEIAIHLGAVQTLVEILRQQSESAQILITTHSADIVDSLPIEALQVVWSDEGSSHLSRVAEHTRAAVRKGLITLGELLRADSLDPETT